MATVPRPDHVVVVMMENHSYADIIGSSSAPYLNSLAAAGASFSQSFGASGSQSRAVASRSGEGV